MKYQEISKRYIARCQRRLKAWGAPLEGWRCMDVYDCMDNGQSGSLFMCELCGCPSVRFVHVMRNELYFEDVMVGCVCAGIMEGDIPAARERERLMRNRAERKRNFIKHPWQSSRPGAYARRYRSQDMLILGRGDSFTVRVGEKSVSRYKGKRIGDLLSATYAAFELADPVKEALDGIQSA